MTTMTVKHRDFRIFYLTVARTSTTTQCGRILGALRLFECTPLLLSYLLENF